MTRLVGKYPDDKFFNQPLIKRPLRRILSKADYASIRDYALMVPIGRVGDYLVAGVQIPYDILGRAVTLAFNLKDGAVYIIFWEGEQHRKFSTKNNQFNLPKEVLEGMGLSRKVTTGESLYSSLGASNNGMHPTPHHAASHVRCEGAGDARRWAAACTKSSEAHNARTSL